jgi:hypothetical protein
MTAPTIRLATDDDMRQIDSRNLERIALLPHLYVPTDGSDVMRSWGIAHRSSIADYVRLYPEALVAPHDFGDRPSRGDLLYNGAEPATALIPQP